MGLNQFGIIGLGVMGSNLAQNFLEHKVALSLYNLDYAVAENFALRYGGDAFASLKDFVQSLETPRKIILMVTAGRPVDEVIMHLLPYLDSADILIDGGNSHYLDTVYRQKNLEKEAIFLIGMGISGGASGARYGASLMPSGDFEAVRLVLPYLKKLAAKTQKQEACVSYIGTGGAGHFIKMVHNGIEYADMQILCDAYAVLRDTMHLSNQAIAEVFQSWNKGRLESYLLGIAADILLTKDTFSKQDIIDVISDKAGSKGTGKWTIQYAITEDLPCGTLFTAVDIRNLSQQKRLGKLIDLKRNESDLSIDQLEKAVYASRVMAYMQGFALMEHASKQYKWNLDFARIAQIWGAGCIIQGNLINAIYEDLLKENHGSLMASKHFQSILLDSLADWELLVAKNLIASTHIPVINAALNDFIGLFTPKLSTSLLQAMRDYFGGHTYMRVDRAGSYHTEWYDLEKL